MVEVNGKLRQRTRLEIEKLLPTQELMEKGLAKHIKIGAFSLIATILLLGVIEPYISIRWSAKRAEKAKKQTLVA